MFLFFNTDLITFKIRCRVFAGNYCSNSSIQIAKKRGGDQFDKRSDAPSAKKRRTADAFLDYNYDYHCDGKSYVNNKEINPLCKKRKALITEENNRLFKVSKNDSVSECCQEKVLSLVEKYQDFSPE